MEIDKFAASLGRLSGREMIIKGIGGTFKTLRGIFKTVGEAYESVFGSSKHSKWLFHFGESLYNFSRKIALNQERIDSIKNTCVKFFKVIHGGIVYIKELKDEFMDLASSKIQVAIETMNEKFGGTFEQARKGFESFVESVRNRSIAIGSFIDTSGIAAGIVAFAAVVWKNVEKYAFSGFDILSRIFEFDRVGSLFEKVGSKIKTAMSDFIETNDKVQFVVTMFGKLKAKMESFGDSVVDIVSSIAKNLKDGAISAKDAINRVMDLFGDNLPEIIKGFSDMSNIVKNFASILGIIIASKNDL